jgi:hypothetical protein
MYLTEMSPERKEEQPPKDLGKIPLSVARIRQQSLPKKYI